MRTAEAALEIPSATYSPRYQIDLYRDLSWVGSCLVENQTISECCLIQLGQSGSETDRILGEIQTAMLAGKSQLELDGRCFKWQSSQFAAASF